MPATSARFPDALDKAMTSMFLQTYREEQADWKTLYGKETSKTDSEKYSSASTVGNIPKFTGGSIPALENEQLYDKTFTHEEFAAKYVAQRKFIDDNKFKQIFDGVSLLGRSARVTKDEEAFSTFNDAFTAQPTDGDGTELCASDHPYSPTDTGTQSNEGTTALSNAAVVAAKKLMRRFNNSKRKNAQIQPDLIVIPTELEETAKEITQSTSKVLATWSSGVVNTEGNLSWFSSRYMTDATDWFLVDSKMMKRFLLMINRTPLEFATTDDFNTLEKWARVYERYSYGWTDWRWIYGELVTG